MATTSKPRPFAFSSQDPLAAEHGVVATWVEDAISSLDQHRHYQDVDLKSLPSGKALIDAKPEQARRFVLVAVAQCRHWDEQVAEIRAKATNEMQRINAHMLPGWAGVWGRRRHAEVVVSSLLRRALPLVKEDFLAILRWCGGEEQLSRFFAPIGHITRALQRYAAEQSVDNELRLALRKFADQLRSSHDKEAKRLGTAVEQLCADSAAEPATVSSPALESRPPPQSTPAGTPGVLDQLKRFRGMLSDEAPNATLVEPDRFPLGDHSPLHHQHELLSALFEELLHGVPNYQPDLNQWHAGRSLLALAPHDLGKALLAAAERHVNALLSPSIDYNEHRVWQSRYAAAGAAAGLLQTQFELERDGLFDLLLYLSARPAHERGSMAVPTAKLIAMVEIAAASDALTEGERFVLWLFRASLISGPPLGAPSEDVMRLTRLINDDAGFWLVPGEAWSDAVNVELGRLDPAKQKQWTALLQHSLTATASRPSAKWLKTAQSCVEAIDADHVRQALMRWLPHVTRGQTIRKLGLYTGDVRSGGDVFNEENANCLRGLLWLVQTLPRPDELARSITTVALAAYKKVPGKGPRAVKVGNAAVYALSELASTEAVGQLAMLKVRVKFGTAQKEIEKAFNAAAKALALPRDQIEEMAVPSYGLEEVGLRRETLGSYRADLVVTGSSADIKWFDAAGKPLKSVPSKVKSDHKDDFKELQQALKDIQAMLPAQRDRIDGMFLLQKSWLIDTWRERYFDHPLLGTIARRLLWCVDGAPALFVNSKPTDARGQPIAHGKTAEITLWHPASRSIDEITAWRTRLETLGITQPFKQAHREIYVLTDAERNTRTYSNRFAAHIVRQHQFNALCAARGWKNKLRLMVDDAYPPATKELPLWGLRAEFWIEGIGQNYGTDTNESGVFLRLATDQVRFYRTQAARSLAHAAGGGYASAAAGPGQDNINDPLPLEQVPSLVFSEIMRDVDLFVGVGSVGNDPTWQDGGPDGRYRQYWHNFSFGELSGTAATRKQVLERLIPRLKIAARCSFTDRFLRVRGQLRTYKIHLGSANILMEPNDQYLCIVPDARARVQQGDLFLPFESDSTLSVIISKAFLLAEDDKIKDPTITRQIKAR